MPTPPVLLEHSPNPNPPTLTENIAAFERLLAHNRRARIVWAHAGWDNTGRRTVDLMRRLLASHPNLYMNIKVTRSSLGSGSDLGPNSPLDSIGRLSLEWLVLIRSFPDRFTIGTDAKYPEDPPPFRVFDLTKTFLSQLPPDLAGRMARINPVRIFKLNMRLICHQPYTAGQQTIWVDASAVRGHFQHGDSIGPCP